MNSIKRWPGGIPAFARTSGIRSLANTPHSSLTQTVVLSCVLFFSAVTALRADMPLPPGGGQTNTYAQPLDSWSFNDTNHWTSDLGFAPVSFTNISSSWLGDGTALVVDSANPAWLRYNVFESNGSTNLTVAAGSVMLWAAPDWSSASLGGTGPGGWGRLIEVGGTNGLGWWSLYTDSAAANLYFSAQTNGSAPVNYLSVPIAWTTNHWHFIALTYSATNTALYLDGNLATNGPGLTAYPGSNVLSNGFFIGSDNAGKSQAHAMFDDIATYNHPVSASTVGATFIMDSLYFLANPLNRANFLTSAPYTPSTTTSDLISGSGYLTTLGPISGCVTSSTVWLTNMSFTVTANQGITFTFGIAGGTSGYEYDVFATSALENPITNAVWAWMGQATPCNLYSITNLPATGGAYLILGTPQDSDSDGLTDAYELLVSHTDPNNPDSDGDGIPDGIEVLDGTNPNKADSDGDGFKDALWSMYVTQPATGSAIP